MRLLLFFSILSSFTLLPAQSILYLHKVDASKGLFDNHNAYLKLDSSGYFYISSGSGLLRYDGTGIDNYRIPTNDNLVTSKVFVDAIGRKWFSTSSGVHTLEADSVRTWLLKQAEGYISIFHLERDSFLWLTAGQQIFVINVFTDFSTVTAKYEGRGFINYPWSNESGDVQGVIRPFFNDSRGIELTHFLQDGRVLKDTIAEEEGKSIRYIEIEDENSFWLASQLGLVEFNLADTTTRNFLYKHDKELDSVQYVDIESFGEHHLIVASRKDGVLFFDKETKCFDRHVTHYYEKGNVKPFGEISHIYVDPQNNLWISELGAGLWHTNLGNQKFVEVFPPDFLVERRDFTVNQVTSVGRDSLIALVDYKDLYLLLKDQNGETSIRSLSLPIPINQKIYGFHRDQYLGWWIETNSSLLLLNSNLNEVIHQVEIPALAGFVDISADTFAILTTSEVYLVPKSNLPEDLNSFKPLELDGNYLEQIHYDPTSKRLFVSYSGTSMQVYDISKKEVHPLDIRSEIGVVSSITPGLTPDTLWMASNAGVFMYHVQSHEFQKITDQEGLLDRSFESIVVDWQGTIWLGSLDGLVRFYPHHRFAVKFNQADGMNVTNYTPDGISKTRERNLIFFGKNGATFIDPNLVQLNTNCPQVLLKSVLVENEQVEKSAFLDKKNLPEFPHYQNDLIFHFSIIEFSDPENNILNCTLIRNSKDTLLTREEINPTFPSLSPGTYELQVLPINSDGISFPKEKTRIFFRIRPPIYLSTLAFIIYGLSFIILVLGVFFYIDRRRRRRYKQEKDRLKFSILQSELKLRLLDHHMISNIFNSITNGIDRQRIDLASWYSRQASRFYRRYLDINEDYAIDLRTEKEYIEEYIALKEKLYDFRFKGTFEIDESIDPEETLIPTFLTQIFVENAIKHGFPADRTDGRLRVQISKQGDQLICEIEDNGIGRLASREHKKNNKGEQSRGIQFTKDRLSIIEEQTKLPTSFEIIDLKNNQGEARGTLVRISYPFEFDIHSRF